MKQNYELQNFGSSTQSQAFVDQSANLTAITSGTPGVGQFLSSVIGRAAIPDITNDMRASFGIERIMTQQIQLVQNETGPNGEPIWSVLNDTNGLIRFVGGDWVNISSTYGWAAGCSNQNSYLEITFYGTGLNLLTMLGYAYSAYATVDGGTESATNIFPSGTQSTILAYRNYAANIPLVVASSLTLGLHTIKIRNNLVGGMNVHGFEILFL